MSTTVLIADNSEFMRALMKRILGDYFEVLDETASDGEEAVALYKEFAPDVIVMELAMPRCNGLKATAALNSLDGGARVVVCTHITDDEPREMAEKVGAAAYVTKPFEKHDLVRAVRDVIS